MVEDINFQSVLTQPDFDRTVIRNQKYDRQMPHRYERGDLLIGLSLGHVLSCDVASELRDLIGGVDAHLITVTEHGSENLLQEGQDVLVGLEQTPHGLQFHHLCIWALCNWECQQRTLKCLLRPHFFKTAII